ncbi:MAG TPA: hypothetical protein PLD30_12290 [Candidatus Competibacteraceae bacterium]|nr:hypothetical protein [Candidatus Competibacteraceae bacterium]
MTALAHQNPIASPIDPMFLARALRRMKWAGFTLTAQGNRLEVSPAGLSDQQRSFIRQHKAALLELLNDAETLHRALVAAGVAGLAWREGTPIDWGDERLLAVYELLHDRRLIAYRLGRHYITYKTA